MAVHKIKQGDTARVFQDTLTIDGEAMDLTGASVAFVMMNVCSGEAQRGTASIISATAGTVRYQPTTTNVATVGRYRAEWEITYVGGKIQTVPEEGYIDIWIQTQLG